MYVARPAGVGAEVEGDSGDLADLGDNVDVACSFCNKEIVYISSKCHWKD